MLAGIRWFLGLDDFWTESGKRRDSRNGAGRGGGGVSEWEVKLTNKVVGWRLGRELLIWVGRDQRFLRLEHDLAEHSTALEIAVSFGSIA